MYLTDFNRVSSQARAPPRCLAESAHVTPGQLRSPSPNFYILFERIRLRFTHSLIGEAVANHPAGVLKGKPAGVPFQFRPTIVRTSGPRAGRHRTIVTARSSVAFLFDRIQPAVGRGQEFLRTHSIRRIKRLA